jgi:outer membrane protein assembly factor BamB
VPTILFDALLAENRLKTQQLASQRGLVTLALARGVLYKLNPADGAIQWARRVGIDTTQLPVLLPRTRANPEGRLLVTSADSATITAVDLEGTPLWTYHLGSPARGRPVILSPRPEVAVAYVATYEGKVHEIELAQGRLLGYFDLNHRLSAGGVHEPGTSRLYFPADDFCVYVLDVAKHSCEAVLYSRHKAGSLRGEPLIIGGSRSRDGRSTTSYLVLNHTDLDRTDLKVFTLPIKAGEVGAVKLDALPSTPGWTWFTPYHDSDKLLWLSDEGRLGLFGIRQVGTNDAELFPLLPVGKNMPTDIDLARFLSRQAALDRCRALVATVQGDEIWVLASEQLRALQVRLNRASGPELTSPWRHLERLGSPLHEAQSHQTRDLQILTLVTQTRERKTCLATTFDLDEPGPDRLVWQRQLGVACQGDPVVLEGEVVAGDQGGGLYRFVPEKFSDAPWQVGGQIVGLPSERRLIQPAQIVPDPDGKGLTQVFLTDRGRRLTLRRYHSDMAGVAETGQGVQRGVVSEETVDLGEGQVVAGPVALIQLRQVFWMRPALLVPVRSTAEVEAGNAKLLRFDLPLTEKSVPRPGPNWMSEQATPDAPCFVVSAGRDRFLTTDGRDGLTLRRWPALGNPGEGQTVKVGARIVTPPLVHGDTVCVADASGQVTLFVGERLTPLEPYKTEGRITAGPFLREGKFGVIVDHSRLVMLDARTGKHLWTHETDGAAIVGTPCQAGKFIVVADETGRFVALNAGNGSLAGPGYQLQATAAPATAPVPFGPGRLFAPLTDGTILILRERDLLRPRFEGWGWPFHGW